MTNIKNLRNGKRVERIINQYGIDIKVMRKNMIMSSLGEPIVNVSYPEKQVGVIKGVLNNTNNTYMETHSGDAGTINFSRRPVLFALVNDFVLPNSGDWFVINGDTYIIESVEDALYLGIYWNISVRLLIEGVEPWQC